MLSSEFEYDFLCATMSKLRNMAKSSKLTNYSHLSKRYLVDLILYGTRNTDPILQYDTQKLNIHSGVKFDTFDVTKHAIGIRAVRDGYMIRGVNLSGKFESQYVINTYRPIKYGFGSWYVKSGPNYDAFCEWCREKGIRIPNTCTTSS